MPRSWKDPFVTLTFPNKVLFTIFSILLFLLHMGILINDLYHFLGSQNGTYMSFHYTFVLLYSHVAAFYLALLASIYTLLAEDHVLLWCATTSLAANTLAFFARFALEFVVIDYREEIHK